SADRIPEPRRHDRRQPLRTQSDDTHRIDELRREHERARGLHDLMQVDTGAYGKDGWLRGLRREAALRSGPLLRTIHRVQDVRYRLRHLLPVEIVTGDQSVRRIDYERAAQ